MKKILLCVFLIVLSIAACAQTKKQVASVQSPNGNIKVSFTLNNGIPFYNIIHNNAPLINNSRMGFLLKDAPSLESDFKIVDVKNDVFDETWTQPWGEVKSIRNNYHSLSIHLAEATGLKRKMSIIFKIYNDGVGFRYQIPEQENLKEFQIADELTEFDMAHNFDAWWIPGIGDTQDAEYLYSKNKLSELKESAYTPFTMEYNDSLFVSIHEAALINYASTTLMSNGSSKLKCELVPWSDGVKVKAKTPMETPWRTLQIANKPGDLMTSYLILNLNEPNKLKDISYVKPGKYMGVWWGMHIKTQSWESGPLHGATTQNVKDLIDFSKNNNVQGVLAEGWNEGWNEDWVKYGRFNFTKPYPDYDIAELSKYAASNGIILVSHHETGGNVNNYESQLDSAFNYLEKNNIHAVKTGYVNKCINDKEYHQGQYMVNHYQKVMETAANHKVMIDVHEPIKDTGLRRTYPNVMTREGVRGTEYEAWSEGNPPAHTAILPFTRGLAGPIDYTPGIFDIQFKNNENFRVHTTLAKQLALYVVIYSPLQMVPDLTKNYIDQPAFKFIVDVPTDWEDTKVLSGKIGEYVTIARKDRRSDNWFLGSITNEKSRVLEEKLSFLTPGKTYLAEIYADGENANYENNPLPVSIQKTEVNSESVLKINLATGGGQAIRFSPLK